MFQASERIALAALDRHASPSEWLRVVSGLHDEPGFWWLDSALPDGRLGRHSFAGADPYLWLNAHGREVELEVRRDVRPGLPRGYPPLRRRSDRMRPNALAAGGFDRPFGTHERAFGRPALARSDGSVGRVGAALPRWSGGLLRLRARARDRAPAALREQRRSRAAGSLARLRRSRARLRSCGGAPLGRWARDSATAARRVGKAPALVRSNDPGQGSTSSSLRSRRDCFDRTIRKPAKRRSSARAGGPASRAHPRGPPQRCP